MKITIYGASDDLIEVEADGPCKGTDEYTDLDCEKRPHLFEIVAPGGESILVYVGLGATWWAGVGMVSEDIPFPVWPMMFMPAPGTSYSLALVLDVPDGTRVIDRMPRLED